MVVSLKTKENVIEASAPRELFASPVVWNGYNSYEVAPDGRRFLVRVLPEPQVPQPLTLLNNWPVLLKHAPPV